MATSAITNTIKDASGTAVANVVVTARLRPGPGFRVSDSSEVAGQVATTSDGSGNWTLNLERTANLTPTNSYWEIEEDIPDSQGGRKTYAISVGSANATLYASLLNGLLPAATIPTALTRSAADALYMAKASMLFNVKDYGALGNGTTDDRAAIQSAITAAAASGGVVFCPIGTFGVGAALYLPSNVTLVGAGWGYTTIAALAGFPASGASGLAVICAGSALNTSYTYSAKGHNIGVTDLTVDGTHTTSTTFNNMGINLDYTDYARVERCKIYNCGGYGVHIAGQNGETTIDFSVNAQAPLVRDCVFDSNGRSIGEDTLGGGFVNDPEYVHNVFINCGGTAIDNIFVNRGVWRDNVSRGNGTNKGGIWSDCGSQGLKILNNEIDQGSIHMFGYLTNTLLGAPQDILIQGNRLTSPGSGAIIVSAGNQVGADTRVCRGIRVIDNLISSATDNAVFFGDVQESIIAGNRISGWNGSNASTGSDNAALRMNSNSTNATARCQNNRVERNIFNSAGGSNQLGAYTEKLAGKTGGNVFADNTFVTAGLTISLDTSASPRTRVDFGSTTFRKTVDETVTSSTTLQNDDELALTVGVNEVWTFDIALFYLSTVAFKVAITSPAGATGQFAPVDFADSTGAYSNLTSDKQDIGGSARVLAPRSTGRLTVLRGVIANGSTAGTLQLQWAQNVSDPSNTTVLAGSYLVAWRVA